MRKRIVVGTWMLIAGSVSIAFPLVAHAQPSAESEISCDAPDALQHAFDDHFGRWPHHRPRRNLHRKLHAQSRHPHPGSGFDQVTLRGGRTGSTCRHRAAWNYRDY